MIEDKNWYAIDEIEKIDTPALVIYKDYVKHNIAVAIQMVDGDVAKLRPHVKTHKTIEVSNLLMDAGITKFKCATISEAEMLGMAGAKDVLLAYQPTGPKLLRFIKVIKKFTGTSYSCLVDNEATAHEISNAGIENDLIIPVYEDMNVGMNRTGIVPGEQANSLYLNCTRLKGIKIIGLHVYDGHIRMTDIDERTKVCNAAFEEIENMVSILKARDIDDVKIVVGGSPSFPIHAKRAGVECSPGTFVFWDAGYQINLPEQKFIPAALVLTRVISELRDGLVCLDLGHKSVASENILDQRVSFINDSEIKFISQSEEHLVIKTNLKKYKPGDVLYGIPNHVCPTCALYERAIIVEDHEVKDEWRIIARDRKITI